VDIFRAALSNLGLRGSVLAADQSRLAAAVHKADYAFVVPSCLDPEFVPTMLNICREHSVRLLVPTIDHELQIYADHRDEFSEIGTTVAVSSSAVTAIGCDKLRTHEWLRECHLPGVLQARASDVSEYASWAYPLLVKPRFGSSSIGVAVVKDYVALQAATEGDEFLVESIASGSEYTIDVLVTLGGQCVAPVPRRRLEVRAGEVSKGVTVRHPQLTSLARAVCESLPGAYGALNIQVILDETRENLAIIELNPRFAGGFPLSWRAGADYARWMIEELARLPSSAKQDAWQEGLVMLRYDDAVFLDEIGDGDQNPYHTTS